MPDTPFKAMGRERRDTLLELLWPRLRNSARCERCAGLVYEGDWPFCRGNPADHQRP